MTAKPNLYLANVDENDLDANGPLVQAVRAFPTNLSASVVPVCAKLEAEIAELDEADRAGMRAFAGLSESVLPAVALDAYWVFGRQSFFTAGEMRFAPGKFRSARPFFRYCVRAAMRDGLVSCGYRGRSAANLDIPTCV